MNLENFFKDIAEQVSVSTERKETFIFSTSTVPQSPQRLVTNNLIVKRNKHAYGSYLNDLLYFQGYKNTYKCLGILILSVVFHPEPINVYLSLTNPLSDIKEIVINYEHKPISKLGSGYHTQPYVFLYDAEGVDKHPWLYHYLYHHPNLNNLPWAQLINSENQLILEDDWKSRDTVIGFGTDEGSVLFAELLLNISQPYNTGVEFELEGDGGFRGVAPTSAEITLLLPGHNYWLLGNEDSLTETNALTKKHKSKIKHR